jgi:AcrR family transcriptional regulator
MQKAARSPRVEPAPEATHRGRGRPREDGVDRRILDAAADIAAEVGIEGLTVSAVIARSGVARATVYRRWPTRDALIGAVVRELKGRAPLPITGDLETDLRGAAEQVRAIYTEPRFRAFLPMLIRDLLREDAAVGVSEAFDRVGPNMRPVAEEYVQLAAGAGMRPEIDPYVVGDVVVGALLARLVSTGRAPTKQTADQVVDVLLNGVRRR